MRVLVGGGGTGGHVYPAIAVLEALLGDAASGATRDDIGWVGSADSIEERILTDVGVPVYPIGAFYRVAASAMRGGGPITAAKSTGALVKGTVQVLGLMRRTRPQVALSTGGYVAAPLMIAAALGRVPCLVYLPDIAPGVTIKRLSVLAQRVAVSFGSAAASFAAQKVVVSGYPVRRALFETDKLGARQALGLDVAEPVVLFLGGSRGAHSINVAVRRHLAKLLERAQVIHISGESDHKELEVCRTELPAGLERRYQLHAYLHEGMVQALAAADLVVARAGAATMGEFPAVGLPAVLVPYPHAGPNQHSNAAFMSKQGAAVIIEDQNLGDRLLPSVLELLSDEGRLLEMSQASRSLSQPRAAEHIAHELMRLAKVGVHG